MTKSASETEPSSTSSEPTEALPRSDKLLALGRKLVDQLGLEPSVDTLGRWMAHYIAELMVKAESTDGNEKHLAQRECFDAILKLWAHRNELPSEKRPFADLEPVMRAIEGLDAENETPRYFRQTRRAAKAEAEADGSKAIDWLELVENADYTAKIIIKQFLVEAAREAADKSLEWVALAEAAGAERGVPELVIRFIKDKDELEIEEDETEVARKLLQGRLERLEAFITGASAVANAMQDSMKQLPEKVVKPTLN